MLGREETWGLERCVNQSCNPNFHASKWIAKGSFLLGIFSKDSIKIGEELTLDYQWDMSNSRNPAKHYCVSHDSFRF